jgi:hypothetical protein
MEARFTTTSVGGKRAVQSLAVAIAGQVDTDQAKPVPVVELDTEHYQHKSYGRIYTPIFKVLEWVSINGGEPAPAAVEAAAPAPAPAPEPAAAPAGRRRRVAA